jgi:hypothetical protein
MTDWVTTDRMTPEKEAGAVGDGDRGPSLLVLRALPRGVRRESAVRLLLGAGRSEEFVRASCEEGQVLGLAALDGDSHDGPVGALVSVPTGAGRTAEVRILALAPGASVGGELLTQFADCLRAKGLDRVVVPASNAEPGLIGLLVGAGYRFLHVERDGCTPARGFAADGVRGSPHRDLVWLELEL